MSRPRSGGSKPRLAVAASPAPELFVQVVICGLTPAKLRGFLGRGSKETWVKTPPKDLRPH